MISLLRKFRKNQIAKNKIGRYFIYATGEVILIVIGILIALGINNWNQERIIKNREHFYLEGLKSEFVHSRLKLEKLIEVNKLNYEESKKLAGFLDCKDLLIDEQELSESLYKSFSYEIAYNPNNSLLQDLINSGGLENISNSELRMYLTSWESVIQSIHRQETSLREHREKILEMFRSNKGSIRTVLDGANISKEIGLDRNSVYTSNRELITSREFENNLLLFILTGMATENSHYKPLLAEIDVILNLIEKEL